MFKNYSLVVVRRVGCPRVKVKPQSFLWWYGESLQQAKKYIAVITAAVIWKLAKQAQSLIRRIWHSLEFWLSLRPQWKIIWNSKCLETAFPKADASLSYYALSLSLRLALVQAFTHAHTHASNHTRTHLPAWAFSFVCLMSQLWKNG